MARYRDLDLDFLMNPVTGDVSQKTDAEAIKRSLRNLVLLGRGDKPFHPEVSCGVRDLLFEPNTSITQIRMKQEIERIVRIYEPRVTVNRVIIREDSTGNGYDVVIRFNINNEVESVDLQLSLQRLR